ncbi:MAG: DUF2461 domain-containing protein [Bacteroidales bacterium]|nr:DUF2461 domain-containing protein [Bacteroidales bacterium]
MKRVIDFFSELQLNNNKTWFDAHKAQYKEMLAVHNDFSEKLIEGLGKIDKSVAGLSVKDCTYRIYRDLRFSHDKTPYKQHIGTYICPHGKKSGYAGYYVHIEPNAKYFICTGLWCPEPRYVKSVREEIMLNGENFEKTIKKADGFSVSWFDSLKKIPNGFSADDKFSEYYKLKSYLIEKEIDEDYLLDKNVIDKLVEDFSKTVDFNTLLNKSVEYAIEMY